MPANTRRAHRGAVDKFTTWLDGRNPADGLLAEYVRYLHEEGKSPSTITIAVAAVNWVSKYAGHPPVGGTATGEALKVARKKEADNPAAQSSFRFDSSNGCKGLRRNRGIGVFARASGFRVNPIDERLNATGVGSCRGQCVRCS